MSAAGYCELLDDFLEQAEHRAAYHGPVRIARAIALLAVEIADEAEAAGEHELWASLISVSDDLDFAADLIGEQRHTDADRFLNAASATLPELGELDVIADVRRLIEART
jgi:hypothetical protein